jgi:hypothetical protein
MPVGKRASSVMGGKLRAIPMTWITVISAAMTRPNILLKHLYNQKKESLYAKVKTPLLLMIDSVRTAFVRRRILVFISRAAGYRRSPAGTTATISVNTVPSQAWTSL